jgi:cell division cycle 2-like
MASKGKSRWADDDDDAALEAQKKREKEGKKRLKAEKARKLEEERRTREAEAARAAEAQRDPKDEDTTRPPAKRRRLSPNRENIPATTTTGGSSKLLRFEGGAFGRCRSVENYDKLNDIEEGAYGWVARAQEQSTGKVVALKRLKIDPKDRSGLPVTGLREIQILKDCDHRNVVKLQEVVVGEDTSKIEKYTTSPSLDSNPFI